MKFEPCTNVLNKFNKIKKNLKKKYIYVNLINSVTIDKAAFESNYGIQMLSG